MEIRVAGHQVDTGQSLRTHVADRMNAMSEKYVSRGTAANVTFGRGPYEQFTCDIVAPVAQGMVLKASNRAEDAHIAFDGAAVKIERQLKRYKEKLKSHHGQERVHHRQDFVEQMKIRHRVFEGRAQLTDPVSAHMEPPLPLLGSGESLDDALKALSASDAVMVVEDGKPLGVLTRHDLLGVHV